MSDEKAARRAREHVKLLAQRLSGVIVRDLSNVSFDIRVDVNGKLYAVSTPPKEADSKPSQTADAADAQPSPPPLDE